MKPATTPLARLYRLWPDIEADRQSGVFKGIDLHTAVAARVFEVDLTAVTPEQRAWVKRESFGLRMGRSQMPTGLSAKEIQKLRDLWDGSFGSFGRWQKL